MLIPMKPEMTPEEFKAKRIQLGITQRELARWMDVTTNTIANKERGRRPIFRTDVIALAALSANKKAKKARKAAK